MRRRCCGWRWRWKSRRAVRCNQILMLVGALVAVSGCHKAGNVQPSSVPDQEKQAGFAAAGAQTVLFSLMDDTYRVRANQHDGLGLAIHASSTNLRLGEPLIVHLAYENLAARGQISATTCQGFSLSDEDEITGVSTAVSIRFACPDDDFLRNNGKPLRGGELHTADVSTGNTKLTFDHPGRYIVMAGWQTFRPTDGMFLRGSEYSSMGSNQVLITVR